MCGIFYSLNCLDHCLDETWLKTRGPDGKNGVEHIQEKFFHYHLSTTQSSRPGIQPLKNRHGILMFNGTTYHKNQSEYEYWQNNLDSDVENIHKTIQSANGEFALIWVTNSHITLATDVFHTKPLWVWQHHDKIMVSSVRSSLDSDDKHSGIYRMKANTILTLDKKNLKTVKVSDTWTWNTQQTVDSNETVLKVFEQVMNEMNTMPENTGMGLSSGMDSGVIHCYLQNKKPIRVCVSHVQNENLEILNQRKKHSASSFDHVIATLPVQSYETVSKLWSHHQQESFFNKWDNSELPHHEISHNLHRKGIKISFSGAGGDEIYSDYGFQGKRFKDQSNFGGYFPQNIDIVWPHYVFNNWLAYEVELADEIGGMYGMETRFPLLDRRLVQAWLSTTAECKNKQYKGWMQTFMKKFSYPYHTSKIGFNMHKIKG